MKIPPEAWEGVILRLLVDVIPDERTLPSGGLRHPQEEGSPAVGGAERKKSFDVAPLTSFGGGEHMDNSILRHF